MTKKIEHNQDESVAVQEAKPRIKRPPLYKVVLNNDDYTPMEFVVQILESIFRMNAQDATRIMLDAHKSWIGVCVHLT